MLGGGNQHTLLHQTGGIADLGDIAADSFYGKAVQICSAKDNASPRRCGQQTQVDRRPTMKPDSLTFDGGPNCLLKPQEEYRLSIDAIAAYRETGILRMWHICHKPWSGWATAR